MSKIAAQANVTPALDIASPLMMAMAYAEHGWRVFPLYSVIEGACNCWKAGRGQACEHPGKHPRITGGFKGATTDLTTISGWWDMWPASNVGIATGAESGIVVLDIDPRNGAMDTIAQLEAEGKTLPEAPIVRTPSGGWHLYFTHPGGKVPSRSNAIGPGLDVKGDGGYVIAPPSYGIGGAYVWQRAIDLRPLR
jgi:hypothetical protein